MNRKIKQRWWKLKSSRKFKKPRKFLRSTTTAWHNSQHNCQPSFYHPAIRKLKKNEQKSEHSMQFSGINFLCDNSVWILMACFILSRKSQIEKSGKFIFYSPVSDNNSIDLFCQLSVTISIFSSLNIRGTSRHSLGDVKQLNNISVWLQLEASFLSRSPLHLRLIVNSISYTTR